MSSPSIKTNQPKTGQNSFKSFDRNLISLRFDRVNIPQISITNKICGLAVWLFDDWKLHYIGSRQLTVKLTFIDGYKKKKNYAKKASMAAWVVGSRVFQEFLNNIFLELTFVTEDYPMHQKVRWNLF